MSLPLGASQDNIPSAGSSPPNSGDNGNSVDQLSELQQFGWKVANGGWLWFPVTNVQTDITQDLAIHKYPDLDGARVENTGRNPITVHATAIFVNTITPSAKESWIEGTLYPNVYQQVITSALQRQTGTLQHPFIGQFSAKLASAHSVIDAGFRGGEMLDLQFIETINDDNILTQIQSTAPQVTSTAATLDTQFSDLTSAQLLLLNQYGFNPDVMASILAGFAIASTIELIFANITNAIISGNFPQPIQSILINTALQQTNALIDACSKSNDNSLANLVNASWLYLSQMQSFYQQFNGSQTKQISIFVTQKAMTLSGIANVIGTDLTSIMTLNPSLLGFPVIKPYSKIRYYASK